MIPLQQIWPDDMAARYRAKGYWRGETFSQLLRSRAEAQGDAVAVVGLDKRWTYGELLQKAETAAAGFLALGLKPGDRVVVQLPNLPEFLSVIFGLFRAKLIPVYALPAHRSTEIVHFLKRSEAAAYVVADRHEGFDYRALARAVQAEVPDLRHVVVVGEAEEFASFDGFRADPAALPTQDADPSDVAFLQISGGSTGLSKLIPRTHDDYLYSVRESADISGLEPESVYLTALPAAHNFPMSSPGYLGALYVGATVVMAPSPSPDVCFPLIEREGVTITGLVPPLALLWMQAAAKKTHDLSSLQVLLVGGAKFLPEAARRVRTELDCTLQQVFGMAEGLVNYTRLDDPESLIVETQGRPISPDDEILIVDDAGAPVAEGEPGNLLTRGPYTIRAYHNEPAANERSFTDEGFYRTGDVVRRTPEGYLVVMGRATDHINRAGEKISAEEVEDHLLAHPAVFDAAVVSVPDDYLGERICAFIIPNGAAPRGVELKAWMRKRDIADFKVPDQIVFVDDFAVTAVGKVSRRELRAALRQRILEEEGKA
ncbi:(2,3-dihydroxybenzoyl)adenylate synthase [Brevundimonas naejangsanensis]|uniref:(2,3-dihydroxybenzoyl)adenylate synthase n=1 Tax=Brevundimonas naejangsanensis TaxID=588932 RepID=UPI000EC3951D|nr:AMP-binding protein [Brevundimonas naejangsanensis]HAC01782.1 2,3-dihydroxybenzoate-AMP ligase [Brevundimonas sp.]HCW49281.1 2,3-dihydroxybenzoate-AMP ligase [Brevundimonas sp.]